MKKYLRLLIITVVSLSMPAGLFPVDVYLTLSEHSMRSSIGIAGFAPLTPTVEESKVSRQLQEVLTNDLLFSRYFNLTEGGPLYSGKPDDIKAWTAFGVAVLVCGELKIEGENIFLTGKIIDPETGNIIFEKNFEAKKTAYRGIAHLFNDEIVKRFIGETGIAHTRIAFSNNKTGNKEIYVVDYDGYNLKRLTYDRSINILPRWSPKDDSIIYTTFRYGNPDLYSLSLSSGTRIPVSDKQGLNTSACYSPDGEKIALTRSEGLSPNLFLIERKGALLRQLTFGRSIQTSPSFAPNGSEIVFVSDNSGYPQLNLMDIGGGNRRRISTEGIVDSPDWSPRGDKIVFSMRMARENYDIYVYDLSSGALIRLTQGEGSNENPRWSPDGRFIVFSSTRSSKREIYVTALDGSGTRKLITMEGSSYTPAWSK